MRWLLGWVDAATADANEVISLRSQLVEETCRADIAEQDADLLRTRVANLRAELHSTNRLLEAVRADLARVMNEGLET